MGAGEEDGSAADGVPAGEGVVGGVDSVGDGVERAGAACKEAISRSRRALISCSSLNEEAELGLTGVVACDPATDGSLGTIFFAEALDLRVPEALSRLASEPLAEVFVFEAIRGSEWCARIERWRRGGLI